MMKHWLFRIGDGIHFNNSSSKKIWGISSETSCSKHFISNAKPGDLLWFVKGGGCGGQIVAMAIFVSTETRNIGPLIFHTLTNKELGWNKTEGDWDTEVHYNNLYNLTHLNMKSEIKGSANPRPYKHMGLNIKGELKCKVDLITEYPLIVRYSKVTNCM
jgi:hypothetical protein